jgi:uncharacterized protein YkwD
MKKLIVTTLLTFSLATSTLTFGNFNTIDAKANATTINGIKKFTVNADCDTAKIDIEKILNGAFTNVNGKVVKTQYSNKNTVAPTINHPSTISAKEKSDSSIEITWSKVDGVKKYKVYRATSKNGAYKYIGATSKTNYVDKGLDSGTTYYYRVRGYKKVNGIKYNGKYSAKVSATTTETVVNTPAPTKKPTATPAPTKKPTATPAPTKKPTATPAPTKAPTKAPTATPAPTKAPTATPAPTKAPTATPAPTKAPTATPAPTKAPTTTPAPTKVPTSTNNYDSSFASQVLKLVNVERVKGGLHELTMSSALVAPANKRAEEIKTQFSHTRPNGTQWSTVLDEFNVSVRTAGENLAYGYNTPEAVVTGWMNSPGHRANIMNANFNKIGVGVYKDSKGTVYATQIFSN